MGSHNQENCANQNKQSGDAEGLSLCGTVDRIVLCRAIQELPKGYRHIFNLHEVEGYEHHKIAQLLQCSIGTSKSQLYKAKMKMRLLLSTKIRIHRRIATGESRKSIGPGAAGGSNGPI